MCRTWLTSKLFIHSYSSGLEKLKTCVHTFFVCVKFCEQVVYAPISCMLELRSWMRVRNLCMLQYVYECTQVKTHTYCVSNCKRSLKKAEIKHFCKTFFKDLEIQGTSKFLCSFFRVHEREHCSHSLDWFFGREWNFKRGNSRRHCIHLV